MVEYLEDISAGEVVELNLPTGMPLVYKLDVDLKPIQHYYLGDAGEIRKAQEAATAQGKAR